MLLMRWRLSGEISFLILGLIALTFLQGYHLKHLSLQRVEKDLYESIEKKYWFRAQRLLLEVQKFTPSLRAQKKATLFFAEAMVKKHQGELFKDETQQLLKHSCSEISQACTELGLWLLEENLLDEAQYYLKKSSSKDRKLTKAALLIHQIPKPYSLFSFKDKKLLWSHPVWAYHFGANLLEQDKDGLWSSDIIQSLEKSYQKGFLPAAEHLGRLYFYKNEWVERDISKSLEYLRFAAQYDYTPALYSLGWVQHNQEASTHAGFDSLTIAAKKGWAQAQFRLAQHLETLILPHGQEIYYWYGRAAEQDHLLAAHRLGILLFQGAYGERTNKDLALYYLEKAAKGGLGAEAENNYAIALMEYRSEDIQAREEARLFFAKAAAKNYSNAAYNLALLDFWYPHSSDRSEILSCTEKS